MSTMATFTGITLAAGHPSSRQIAVYDYGAISTWSGCVDSFYSRFTLARELLPRGVRQVIVVKHITPGWIQDTQLYYSAISNQSFLCLLPAFALSYLTGFWVTSRICIFCILYPATAFHISTFRMRIFACHILRLHFRIPHLCSQLMSAILGTVLPILVDWSGLCLATWSLAASYITGHSGESGCLLLVFRAGAKTARWVGKGPGSLAFT
ncbi:hypothetical protein C8R45DRAFT_1145881 [Mycena sanguinolenta]|nr:hypothetical protein C8R45DRAFT_1145881 [Mycena sanguinolenta]